MQAGRSTQKGLGMWGIVHRRVKGQSITHVVVMKCADSTNMSGRRTRRRRELLRLMLQKAKRKLKVHRRRRSALTEEQKIQSFVEWCGQVGLDLHPKVLPLPGPHYQQDTHTYLSQQIRIGRRGSCAAIGVVALEDIARGECVAVIPRNVLLSCSNCEVGGMVARDPRIMKDSTSSWVPLLIALAAECSKKVNFHSHSECELWLSHDTCYL